ncbi:MAG: hypothetical protein ACKO6N_05560 [Myxococcota bacterium]
MPSAVRPGEDSNSIELEARLTMLEMRLTSLSSLTSRVESLESLSANVERLQARLKGMESLANEVSDISGRMGRIEAELAKLARQTGSETGATQIARITTRLDALDTKVTPLVGLPERLRTIEKRGNDSGDLGGRVEALEAGGPQIQRLQKSVGELQARLEVGLEESCKARPTDSGTTQRLIEARVSPIEQRIERLVAQSRTAPAPDDSRVHRLEQRVSRLNAMVESLSTDDENVKITKLERSIVSLRTRLEGLENNPDGESGTVEVLGERLDGIADELSGIRTNMHQLAQAIEILQDAAGFERNDDEDEDEDEEPDWDEDED